MFNTEVLNVKFVEGKGKLKAFADICINGELTVKGIRIIEDSEGSEPWIGLPQTTYESNGTKKYVAVVETTERLKKQIRDAVVIIYRDKSLSSV
jgi:DNA-binding cell septation regulator SpoVG